MRPISMSTLVKCAVPRNGEEALNVSAATVTSQTIPGYSSTWGRSTISVAEISSAISATTHGSTARPLVKSTSKVYIRSSKSKTPRSIKFSVDSKTLISTDAPYGWKTQPKDMVRVAEKDAVDHPEAVEEKVEIAAGASKAATGSVVIISLVSAAKKAAGNPSAC